MDGVIPNACFLAMGPYGFLCRAGSRLRPCVDESPSMWSRVALNPEASRKQVIFACHFGHGGDRIRGELDRFALAFDGGCNSTGLEMTGCFPDRRSLARSKDQVFLCHSVGQLLARTLVMA